jgi:hypothetical protein
MRRPDADLDRYLALLKDADDEPKRLALIQLLIAEGARDKLSAKSEPVQTKPPPLPQPQPFNLLALTELPLPLRVDPLAGSQNGPSSKEQPQDGAHDDGQTRLPLSGIDHSSDPATTDSIPPVLPEPSRADELVDKIAKLLSERSDFAKAVPAATNGSPPTGQSSGNDVENSIAALIRAELAKR